MTFDVVIGNPPYNDDTEHGKSGSGNSIYVYFILMGGRIGKYSSLVTPSGWMTKRQVGVKDSIIEMIRNSNFKKIVDFENSKRIFEGVRIATGISYYLMGSGIGRDKVEYEFTDMTENTSKQYRELYNKYAENIIRNNIALDIVDKICDCNFESFGDKYVGKTNTFGSSGVFECNWTGYSTKQTDDFNIKYYLNLGNDAHGEECISCNIDNLGYAWVSEEQIAKNKELYSKHKILLRELVECYNNNITSTPVYVGNNNVCYSSYIPVFSPNDTEEESINICKYIKTRFFRYLVMIMKQGNHLSNSVYKLVPVLDFTNNSEIDWSKDIEDIENQLYKKYNIAEYIEHINGRIEKMGD